MSTLESRPAAATSSDVEPSALADLRRAARGEVLTAESFGYETHRKVWNGSIDRRPRAIVRCTGVDDVRAALAFGRRHDLPIALRGGGHSFPGLSTCDGGLLVDLRPMDQISIDPDRREASVQPGVLIGELDEQTQRHGLAVPAGIVSHTGLAGLTLGGGLGWLMRRHGLTVDQLAGATVVTADGELVHADADENADLFWGLRGGGGNFGVVTSFDFRLVPVGPQVFAGAAFWPVEQTEQLLRFYRDWVAEAPDALMTIVVQRLAPALPVVPPELVGRPVVAVAACFAGDVEDGERALRPLRSYGAPVLDLFAPKPFVQHQAMFDPSFRHGCWYYVRACDVEALSDEVIAVMAQDRLRVTSPLASVAVWQMGGAVARVGDDETAFNGRRAGFTFNINGNTETRDGFEEQRQWARDYWTALAPFHQSVYVNFLMEEGQERVRQAYGAGKYDRLRGLKRKYDPANVFRLNQNIPPA